MSLKKKNITFIITFICLNILYFLMFMYHTKQENIQKISNNYYSNNSIIVDKETFFNIEELINDDLRVFFEFNDNIRVIYKSSEDWAPNIKSGRFFEEKEKGNKAIIGIEYVENLKEIDGKNYITMFGKDFEVIGVMQEDFVSRLDSLLFLKSDVIPKFDIKSVVIEGNNKVSINKLIDKIKKYDNELAIEQFNSNLLNLNIKSDFFYKLIMINTSLLICISGLVFIKLWFEINISFFKTQFLLGVSYKNIRFKFLLNIVFNILISDLVSAFFMFKYNAKYVVIMSGVNLLIIIITSILLVNSWIKHNNIKCGEEIKYAKRT